MASYHSSLVLCLVIFSFCSLHYSLAYGNFNQDFDVTWGDGRAKVLNNGKLLTLSLDKASGSGVKSKKEYLFGRIDMQLKLVRGNSAGTVATYYLSSQGATHDEIDFEFLGNLSGDPYIVHTNVYTQGKGDKEQQFYLWFDPTADFHTYSILWNPQTIIFFVDGTPIRVFKNMKSSGVAYPNNQPMRVYASLWNADDWATRGGLVKTDWSNAPFIASFRNFKDNNACVWEFGKSSCTNSTKPWFSQQLDSTSQARLQWVQNNYMLSSQGSNHDEIDFEFLGNLSGEPYTLHTNVYTQGKGEREQQFHLWFDPTNDFHTYSILWNPHTIVFSVENIPIREFKNLEDIGVAFPKSQAMKLYSSLWNADEWATMGGLIKTDWAQAPFTASYRNFNANICNNNNNSSCKFLVENLDPVNEERLRRVQQKYMIYNYCTDNKRFPQGFPPECSAT